MERRTVLATCQKQAATAPFTAETQGLRPPARPGVLLFEGDKFFRLFKRPVQQGRSERKGEAYVVRYAEPLSDARTLLAGFFNSLCYQA
jgi:hypothetical protein